MNTNTSEMDKWTEEDWDAYFEAGKVERDTNLNERANGHVWELDEDGHVATEFWHDHHDGPRCARCGERFCRNCYNTFPPCGSPAPESDDSNVLDPGAALLSRLAGATVADVLNSKR